MTSLPVTIRGNRSIVTEILGVKQRMTSTYNPMADGQAEKAIGTLTNTLSKLTGANPEDWDLLIPYALWAYRTAKHAQQRKHLISWCMEETLLILQILSQTLVRKRL